MLGKLFYGFMNASASTNLVASTIQSTVQQAYSLASDIVTWIFGFVGLAATVWAIYLAITMARADSAEKREEAKKRVIYCIIGVIVCVLFILIAQFVIAEIPNWTSVKSTTPDLGA